MQCRNWVPKTTLVRKGGLVLDLMFGAGRHKEPPLEFFESNFGRTLTLSEGATYHLKQLRKHKTLNLSIVSTSHLHCIMF
jgi:hypothetical protein